MRTLTLLLTLLLSLPLTMLAQSDGELFSKVSMAVDENRYEQAEKLFREAVFDDVENAELFYWTYWDKQGSIAPRLAYDLALYYEKAYNYEKASIFYKECIRYNPQDVKGLLMVARMDVMRGKENEAIHTYEKVLSLEPDNLDAHIYAGNYYYLQGKLERQQVEQNYKRVKAPTHMQYAHYRNELDRVFSEKFTKSRSHFEHVLKQFSSVGAKKALTEIERIKKEISE